MKNSLDLDLVVHVPESCPLKSNADERYITLQIVLLCIGLSSQLLANGYRSLDLANPLLFLVLKLLFQLCTGLFVSGVWKPCRGSCLLWLWKLLPHSCRESWDHRWEGCVRKKGLNGFRRIEWLLIFLVALLRELTEHKGLETLLCSVGFLTLKKQFVCVRVHRESWKVVVFRSWELEDITRWERNFKFCWINVKLRAGGLGRALNKEIMMQSMFTTTIECVSSQAM